MSILIESLKGLYSEKHYITIDYINSLKEKDKITQEEYDYIIQDAGLTIEQYLSEMESEVGINGQ